MHFSDHQASPRTLPRLLPWLLLALVVSIGGRIASIFGTDVFTDEAVYLWMSYRSWELFLPHPPGSTLPGRLGVALLGQNEAGVRLFPFLYMLAMLPLSYAVVRRLGGGKWAAWWTVLALLATPIYCAFASLFTPDAPEMLMWALLLWLTHRALCRARLRDWLAVGTALGIGLWAKYILILYVPALAVVLLATRAGRGHLKRPGPWLAIALAAIMIGPPVLIKEHATGWPTFKYHLRDRQERVAPSAKLLGIYYGAHFAYYSPLLYLMAFGGLVAAGATAFRRKEAGQEISAPHSTTAPADDLFWRWPSREAASFLFTFSAVPLLFFGSIAMVTKRELSREHWDAIAYPPAYMAIALWLERRLTSKQNYRVAWRALAIIGPAVGLLTYAAVVYEGVTGKISAAFHAQTPVLNLFGWKKMAALADAQFATMPTATNGRETFFLGNAFPEMVTYNFYGHATKAASCLEHKIIHEYGLQVLFGLKKVDEQHLVESRGAGTNAVYVNVDEIPPIKKSHDKAAAAARAERDRARNQKRLEALFDRVEPAPGDVYTLGGRPIIRYTLFRCFGLKPNAGKQPPPLPSK